MNKIYLLSLIVCCLFMSFSAPNTDNGQTEKIVNNNANNNDNNLSVIKWISFEEAMRKSQKDPKKVFVDIYTDWCLWCTRMEKSTFQHPTIAKYINENFYPVKLDAEMRKAISFKNNNYVFRPGEGSRGNGVHEMAIYLTRGRLNYPSVVFLDENMSNPQPVPGFLNPTRMDKLLKFFGENYYKQIDWGLFNQIYKSPLN